MMYFFNALSRGVRFSTPLRDVCRIDHRLRAQEAEPAHGRPLLRAELRLARRRAGVEHLGGTGSAKSELGVL